jgi:hypothetical protein
VLIFPPPSVAVTENVYVPGGGDRNCTFVVVPGEEGGEGTPGDEDTVYEQPVMAGQERLTFNPANVAVTTGTDTILAVTKTVAPIKDVVFDGVNEKLYPPTATPVY